MARSILIASYFLSAILLWRLWRSEAERRDKILYTILLLIPVVGPMGYFWLRTWPPSLSPELQQRYGTMGRKFLDQELSAKSGTRSVDDETSERVASNERHREEKRVRKERAKRFRYKRDIE